MEVSWLNYKFLSLQTERLITQIRDVDNARGQIKISSLKWS